MNRDYFNVGVRPKSSYASQGGVRGLKAKNMSVDAGKEYHKSKKPLVELYAERWDQGLDIWTGEPLEGAGLTDWKNQRKKRNQLE